MRKSGIYNAIVFGSTGVLGSNISFELAKKDINLVLQGRSLEKLKDLSDKISQIKKPTLVQGDVTKKEFYDNLFKSVSQKFKKIDLIVNLIGQFNGLKPLTHLSHSEWDKFIEINISSYWRILKELEPLIRIAEKPKLITLTNSDISVGKAYHNIFSICLGARNSMFQTFKEENKNLNLKIISVDVQQINNGMSSSLRGNKKCENQNLQKVSEDIINNFL